MGGGLRSRPGEAFVELRVEGGDAGTRERAAAEAFAAGASGLEECDGPPPALRVYAPASRAEAVDAALRGVGGGLRVSGPRPVPPVAWDEAWKRGLGAVVVSERLVVRPPFAPRPPGHRGFDLVIEPGQAFGTGAHGTTRLALELLDGLPYAERHGARALDVGCGSGVLALAALGLGAARAVACDLDPLASAATVAAARAHGLAGRTRVFTGSVAALAPSARFELVLANMIRSELVPLLDGLAAALAESGVLVVSGLLEEERAGMQSELAARGLRVEAARSERDERGDAWLALRARR